MVTGYLCAAAKYKHPQGLCRYCRVVQGSAIELPSETSDDSYQLMKRLSYNTKLKIMRSLGWFFGCCVFLFRYGYSWTFVS